MNCNIEFIDFKLDAFLLNFGVAEEGSTMDVDVRIFLCIETA